LGKKRGGKVASPFSNDLSFVPAAAGSLHGQAERKEKKGERRKAKGLSGGEEEKRGNLADDYDLPLSCLGLALLFFWEKKREREGGGRRDCPAWKKGEKERGEKGKKKETVLSLWIAFFVLLGLIFGSCCATEGEGKKGEKKKKERKRERLSLKKKKEKNSEAPCWAASRTPFSTSLYSCIHRGVGRRKRKTPMEHREKKKVGGEKNDLQQILASVINSGQ